jgi:hypothetical protein
VKAETNWSLATSTLRSLRPLPTVEERHFIVANIVKLLKIATEDGSTPTRRI